MMKNLLVPTVMIALLAVSACSSEKVEVLKTPCAGAEGSPCGPKRDVNGWWLNAPADQA